MQPNGIVLWRGPSKLDRTKRIVVILTGMRDASGNSKTGAMLQTWILCEDESPVDAIKSGLAYSICGDCPHIGTSCYVNVGQAPLAIWRAYKRGAYPAYDASQHDDVLRGAVIRFGAYGDPAACPIAVWRNLESLASSHTGYTHQWRTHNGAPLRALVMASCDSESDREEAKFAGWRTFRMRTSSAPLLEREISCPASEEEGKRRTCETCRACRGAGTGVDVTIVVHGLDWKKQRFSLI